MRGLEVELMGSFGMKDSAKKEGKDIDGVELALMYNELPQQFKKILLSPYVNTEYNEARFVIRIVDSDENLRRDELLKKIQKDLVILYLDILKYSTLIQMIN